MKKMVRAGLAALVLASPVGAFADEYTLITGEYPPYTSESAKNFGIASQIIEEALATQGHDVQMTFKPWARAMAEAANAQAHGTFPWSVTDERAETFKYSNPLYDAGIYLFARADEEIPFEHDADLQGLNMCLPISYNDKRVKPMVEAGIVTLSRPQDMDACYRMLAGGRTDLVVNSDIVGRTEIKRLFGSFDQFQVLPTPLRTTVQHVMVGKSHPEGDAFLATFNAGLAELRESGRIEEIFLEQLR